MLALFLAACEPPNDETGSREIVSVRVSNGEVAVDGGTEQEKLLTRSLIAAMARASAVEAELEELQAYCPRAAL